MTIEFITNANFRNRSPRVNRISDEDSDLLQYTWSANGDGYLRRNKPDRKELHRLILERIIGRSLERGETVDHINRDVSDNRRENLRLATYRENLINRSLQSNNKSGYRGVSWDKYSNKWYVYIKHNRKKIYIGLFDDVKDAARAYNEKAKEIHGDFYVGNEID